MEPTSIRDIVRALAVRIVEGAVKTLLNLRVTLTVRPW